MASQRKPLSTPSGATQDAIASLMEDHKRVKTLFKAFENLKEEGSSRDKADVVRQICDELTVHTTIEEEIFYPALREKIQDQDLMDEALVEHAGAKELVAQLEGMTPEDEMYDARVKVLSEQIEHHVKEEEGEMFPQARKAKVDTAALGQEMERRRSELKADLGMSGDSKAESDVESDAESDEDSDEESVGGRKKRASGR